MMLNSDHTEQPVLATGNSTNKRSRPVLSRAASLTIIAALLLVGVGALWLIFNTEPVPQRESAVRETAMLVEVTTVNSGTFRPVIQATGVVRPAREIVLRPRIDGEVIELSDALVPGGFVKAGDMLLSIDDADYRIAMEQRQSELQQAIADLEIEHGRQEIAERDYRELGKTLESDNRALVLREPQLKAADARVKAAQAAVEKARLDLERTRVRAPFDAQVLAREVNLGSQVSSGDALARLVGVDTYWVETTLSLDRLRWLSFGNNGGNPGSPVTIRHRTAWPPEQSRQGFLFQLVGELEGDTRMARALVTVNDPLAREADSRGLPPLVIGSFVQCLLEGLPIENVVKIRRDYVRKKDTAWVMANGQLSIRPLDIVFQDSEYAYVRNGLSDGDQVVITSLATVKEGIQLRLKSEGESAPTESA
jgi:RND family efflux transporter MFP subunit